MKEKLFAPALTKETDKPLWISKDSFLNFFDKNDFLSREVVEVEEIYLSNWFYDLETSNPKFILPTFSLINGKTEFINGRHRAAVLAKYMKNIPFAFVGSNLDYLFFLKMTNSRRLYLNELILLPDITIRN